MTDLVKSYLFIDCNNKVVTYEDLPIFLPSSAWEVLEEVIKNSEARFEIGELVVDGQIVCPPNTVFFLEEEDFEEGVLLKTDLPDFKLVAHPQECVRNQLDVPVEIYGGFIDPGDEIFALPFGQAVNTQLSPTYPHFLSAQKAEHYGELCHFSMQAKLSGFIEPNMLFVPDAAGTILGHAPNPHMVSLALPDSLARGRPEPQSGGVYKNSPSRKPQMDQAMNPQAADGYARAHSNSLGGPRVLGDHTHNYTGENVGAGKTLKKEEPEEEGTLYDRLRGVKSTVDPETPQSKDDQEEVRRRVEESKKIINNMFAF